MSEKLTSHSNVKICLLQSVMNVYVTVRQFNNYSVWGHNILSLPLHPSLCWDEKRTKKKAGTVLILSLHIWSSHWKYSNSCWPVNFYRTHKHFKYRKKLNNLCFKYNTFKIRYYLYPFFYVQNTKEHTNIYSL